MSKCSVCHQEYDELNPCNCEEKEVVESSKFDFKVVMATGSIVFGLLGFIHWIFISSIIGILLSLPCLFASSCNFKRRAVIGLVISIISFLVWFIWFSAFIILWD